MGPEPEGPSLPSWIPVGQPEIPVDRVCEHYAALRAEAGISRIADITGLDHVGVPVFQAIRPTSYSIVVSVGKNLDPVRAKAAAMMESLELWHAERIDATARHLAWRAAPASAVDPRTLPTFPGAAADPDRPIDWLVGLDLQCGQEALIPLEAVSMDYRSTSLSDRPTLARTSNGLAAGATPAHAIVHGLCEVIERDAEWRWRESDDERRLDLASVADSTCRTLLERITAAGLYAAAWDVTTDLGVPSYGCVVLERPDAPTWRPVGVHDGFACRPDPAAALAAALLEALQKRLTYISGSRDDLSRAEFARANDTVLASNVWTELTAQSPTTRLSGQSTTGDVAADLVGIARRLADRKLRVIAVELTRAGQDGDRPSLPVWKVIVPGLYGPWGSCEAPGSAYRPIS